MKHQEQQLEIRERSSLEQGTVSSILRTEDGLGFPEPMIMVSISLLDTWI